MTGPWMLVLIAGALVSLTQPGSGPAKPAEAPAAPAAAKATLADLAFIAGSWRGEEDGSVSEEQWSSPEGGCMVGHFRMISGGKPVFYELLAIEETPEGPTLRLRHFGPGLEAKEGKASPPGYVLVVRTATSAVFERAGDPAAKPPRLAARQVYRVTGGDTLTIEVHTERGGEPHTMEFSFKRQR